MNDHFERLRKEIKYVASHRGTKESDFLIGGFVELYIKELKDGELEELRALLQVSDVTLFDWLLDRERVPEVHQGSIFERLQRHVKTVRGDKL